MRTVEEIKEEIDFIKRVHIKQLEKQIKIDKKNKILYSPEEFDLEIRKNQIKLLEWVLGDSK